MKCDKAVESVYMCSRCFISLWQSLQLSISILTHTQVNIFRLLLSLLQLLHSNWSSANPHSPYMNGWDLKGSTSDWHVQINAPISAYSTGIDLASTSGSHLHVSMVGVWPMVLLSDNEIVPVIVQETHYWFLFLFFFKQFLFILERQTYPIWYSPPKEQCDLFFLKNLIYTMRYTQCRDNPTVFHTLEGLLVMLQGWRSWTRSFWRSYIKKTHTICTETSTGIVIGLIQCENN